MKIIVDTKIRFLAAGVIICLGIAPSTALARQVTEVDSCPAVVNGGDVLVTADIVCDSLPGSAAALTLYGRGTIDLQGFSITGDAMGVSCGSSCRIVGGGIITAVSGSAVQAVKRLRIEDVSLVDSGENGVRGKAVVANDVTIANNGGYGIVAERLKLYDSTVTGNGFVSGHYGGFGISRSAKVVASTITGNAYMGATSFLGKVTLVDSTVTGNTAAASCGTTAVCADVVAARHPRVRSSTCGTSLDRTSCMAAVSRNACQPGAALTVENDPALFRFGFCEND